MTRPGSYSQLAQALAGILAGVAGCSEPSEPYRYLVGAGADGTACVFTHDVLDGSGFFDVACEEAFYFSDDSDALWLDDDQEITSSPTRMDGVQVARMTAQLVVTESVGEINYETHTVPSDYLRRYTVRGELDCDADPELGCEGLWSFDLVGEQTNEDVVFRRGEP
jgi:hypothetical protein